MDYPDQTRNLNPTPEAVMAMVLFGDEYGRQTGGSMDFWDGLSERRKRRCTDAVASVLQAHAAHTTQEGE